MNPKYTFRIRSHATDNFEITILIKYSRTITWQTLP